MPINAAIALNRFGLGARAGELGRVGDARRYLKNQLRQPQTALINDPALLDSSQAFIAYSEGRRERVQARQAAANAERQGTMAPMAEMQTPNAEVIAQRAQRLLGSEIAARVRHGTMTEAGFLERWVMFWSNHFTMAATGAQKVPFAGPFEREAIRPNVLGSFATLLSASTFHPGMLVYLDQAQSVGPNSPAASRAGRNGRVRGLNENLAREILELHTLGTVPGGSTHYTQADVTEFARALTGWTIVTPATNRLAGNTGRALGTTIFARNLHEPGTRTIIGKRYSQTDSEQAPAILADLAAHPATARKIATKLARHFIADDPPASLVARLEATFIRTRGDLKALAETLIDAEESWNPTLAKFKTPSDFLLSTLRAGGASTPRLRDLRNAYEQLGQLTFRAPSPEGWPDDAASWAGPDAILKRVDWANLVAERIAESQDAMAFAQACLGESLSPTTARAITRAQTQHQAITLVLMSPEFQRR